MPSRRKIRFNPAAEDDFSQILQYTMAEWGEDQADEYFDAMMESIDTIAMFRNIGRARDEWVPGLRSLSTREHVIFCTADRSHVIVWRILHKRHLPIIDDFS